MAKPTGAICNLACTYCFFLDKEAMHPGSSFRMDDETLEAYVRGLIEAHRTTRGHVRLAGRRAHADGPGLLPARG